MFLRRSPANVPFFTSGLILVLFCLECLSQGPEGQNQPDLYYLRRDQQLRPKLSIAALNPTFAELLDLLRKTTDLKLTVDKSLKHHKPIYGDMQFKDAPAFSLMEFLAEKDIDAGRWEKTPDGYRLTGKTLAPGPPSFFGSTAFAFGAAAALALAVFLGAILFFRSRKLAKTRNNSKKRLAPE